eukprot:493587-Pyramimonas_sp.AAC.1
MSSRPLFRLAALRLVESASATRASSASDAELAVGLPRCPPRLLGRIQKKRRGEIYIYTYRHS